MDFVRFISEREGERMICLGLNHHLTKEAVMSMEKIKKDGSWTWGGWIHAFWCVEINGTRTLGRPTMVYRRYDAYND